MMRWSVFWQTIVLLLVVRTISAEQLPLGTAPVNPVKAGFSMTVTSPRLGNDGFQPVKLRFSAIGPSFLRQRQLRILFRPRMQYRSELDFQFSCDVTLPEDAKTYDASVLIPHYYRWESCSVQILEDGQRLGKTQTRMGIQAAVKDWGQHTSFGIIVPRDAEKLTEPWARFPDVRSILTTWGDGPIDDQPNVKRLDSKNARNYIERIRSGYARFRILDELSLQRDWLAYSQLDVIMVPAPVLRRIEVEQPQQHEALRRWVSTGGQIWAYACGSNPQSIQSGWLSKAGSELASELNYDPKPTRWMSLADINDDSPIQFQPWNYGSFFSSSYSYGSAAQKKQQVYDDLVQAKNPMVQTESKAKLTARLQFMRYGLGKVVLINDDDPFPGSFQFWNALDPMSQRWNERHGINYAARNDIYWAWSMATVGNPPVTAFVILNGLFVIIIGPVFYFSLRRKGRLFLLYFLAPAFAFSATMGLFAYAFVSDGFDNRAKIRQLTWIDTSQPSTSESESTTTYPIVDHFRHTYYTVLDNRRGLRFDGQSLVLPVPHSAIMDQYSYFMADDSRPGDFQIRQDGDDRLFTGDFLPTRSQTHFLTTRPDQAELPFEFNLSKDSVTVTNHLPTLLSTIAIRDQQGRYWIQVNVEAGKTATLERVGNNAFLGIVAQFIEPNIMLMPEPFRIRYAPEEQTAIERWFEGLAKQPPNGCFLAVTDVDESEFALRECEREGCNRVIGGLIP